jgi:hypothetical protein
MLHSPKIHAKRSFQPSDRQYVTPGLPVEEVRYRLRAQRRQSRSFADRPTSERSPQTLRDADSEGNLRRGVASDGTIGPRLSSLQAGRWSRWATASGGHKKNLVATASVLLDIPIVCPEEWTLSRRASEQRGLGR